jgi:hypothetical protein
MTGEDKIMLSLFNLFTAYLIKHLQLNMLQIYKEAGNHSKDF